MQRFVPTHALASVSDIGEIASAVTRKIISRTPEKFARPRCAENSCAEDSLQQTTAETYYLACFSLVSKPVTES